MKITVQDAIEIANKLIELAQAADEAGNTHISSIELADAIDLDDAARAELEHAIAEARS